MSDLTFGELRKVVNSNTMVNSLPPMKGRSGQSPLISGMGYMKSWLAWHSVQSLWYTNEHPTNYVGIFLSKKFDRFRIVGEHGEHGVNDYPKLARLKKKNENWVGRQKHFGHKFWLDELLRTSTIYNQLRCSGHLGDWHISSHNPTKSCSLFLGYQETKVNHINVQWRSYTLNNSTQHTLHINSIIYIYLVICV